MILINNLQAIVILYKYKITDSPKIVYTTHLISTRVPDYKKSNLTTCLILTPLGSDYKAATIET